MIVVKRLEEKEEGGFAEYEKGGIDCSLKCVDLHRDKVCCGNRSFQQVFFSWRFRSNYVDLLLTNVITVETQNIAVNAR